ncbi:MAG: response regulator transcription factor [Verrucomicrobiota bacterium]
MNAPINVAILEDNRQYVESLRKVFQYSEDFELGSVFQSAEELVESLNEPDTIRGDVLLLDLNLPGRSGMSVIPDVLRKAPALKVLVLTRENDYTATLEAIKLGASGYILKDMPINGIREAIRDVFDGGCVIDPQLSKLLLGSLIGNESLSEEKPLSEREVDVLRLMALGYAKKQVADELNVSYGSVAQATQSIYRKLQVPNITAAVSVGIRQGLI